MPKYKEEHPNWKGGRYKDSRGYVYVRIAPGEYVREQRLIMEQIFGRTLQSYESVHHKNGNKSDNRPENLELHTKSTHTRHHWDTGEMEAVHIKRPASACHPQRPHYGKGMCRQCYMAEAQKKYRSKHPERLRKAWHNYKKENREKINTYRRKRYDTLKKQGLSPAEARKLS